MKKMMIAVCAIALAAVAQAANVNWKIQTNVAEVGNSMYAVLASDLASCDMTKLALTDITVNALAWNDNAGGSFDAASIISKSGKGTTAYTITTDSALTAANANIYLIVVKADKSGYALLNTDAYDVTAKVYADGESTPGAFAAANTTALEYTSFGGGQSIPEPTSALMLLVGLAGLALKRKVA